MIIWTKEPEGYKEFTLDSLYCFDLNKRLIAEDKVIESYGLATNWYFTKIVCDYLWSLWKERNAFTVSLQNLASLMAAGQKPSRDYMDEVKKSLNLIREMKVRFNDKKHKWELLPREDKSEIDLQSTFPYLFALYGFSLGFPEDIGISEGD